jgi:hypothetical protein
MGLHLTKYLDDFDMPASSLPTASQLSLLKRLNSELNTPCTDCQDDLLLLRQVWETVVSPAEFPSPDFSIPSPLWSDHLGFQSPNPISDIRGGGRLSARCLLHFVRSDMGRSIVTKARKRRDEAVEELGNEGRPDSFASYPLAPALINMTRFIAHILGVAGEHGQTVDVSKKRSPFYSLLKSERDFAVAVTGEGGSRNGATPKDLPNILRRRDARAGLGVGAVQRNLHGFSFCYRARQDHHRDDAAADGSRAATASPLELETKQI